MATFVLFCLLYSSSLLFVVVLFKTLGSPKCYEKGLRKHPIEGNCVGSLTEVVCVEKKLATFSILKPLATPKRWENFPLKGIVVTVADCSGPYGNRWQLFPSHNPWYPPNVEKAGDWRELCWQQPQCSGLCTPVRSTWLNSKRLTTISAGQVNNQSPKTNQQPIVWTRPHWFQSISYQPTTASTKVW